MKTKKKISIVVLAILMLLSLCACKSETQESFDLTVLVSVSEGLSISGDNSFKVAYGENVNIPLAFEDGYELSQVLSDGQPTADYTYTDGVLTLGPITSSKTISIIAEKPEETHSEEETTAEEVTTVEETTTTEEVTTTEEITTTEEVTTTEAETTVEEVTTAKEEETTAEVVTTAEEVTATEEVTTAEEVTATEEVTTTEEVTATEEVTTAPEPELPTPTPTGGKLPTGSKTTTKNIVNVVYYPNGGVAVRNKESYTHQFSLERYSMINTLPDNDTFARNGYVLIGYSTKPEGGEIIGIGHKMEVEKGAKKIELYCQWKKAASLDELDYKKNAKGGVRINSYKGNASEVYIPKTIEDEPVVSISTGCFKSDNIKSVYLPSTVTSVKEGAFICPNLEKLTMFDSITDISDKSFTKTSIKTLSLNLATFPRYSSHSTGYSLKFERVITSDKPCVIVMAGSSILYGLDTEYAEQLLDNKYRVVNLGISAETNVVFQMEAILPYLDKDDIIIYAPEQYAEHTYHTAGNPEMNDLTFRILELNYALIENVDLRNHKGIFDNYRTYANNRLKLPEVHFETFSAYIDPVGDCGTMKPGPNADNYVKGTNGTFRFCDNFFIKDHIPNMNRAIDAVKATGAQIFFSHPTYNKNAADPKYLNEESYDAYNKYLSEVLNAEVISDVRNYIMSGQYFDNTDYHTNIMGQRKYTKQLMADLKAAIGED